MEKSATWRGRYDCRCKQVERESFHTAIVMCLDTDSLVRRSFARTELLAGPLYFPLDCSQKISDDLVEPTRLLLNRDTG